MAAFFLLRRLFGLAPWPYHLLCVLVHAANAALVLRLLLRRYAPAAALGAALLFAVLPVHVEAVAYVSELPETLMTVFVLLAWLSLERPEAAQGRGLLFFALALLSKEQAIMFPGILALHDWAFHKTPFWSPKRRGLYLALAGCAAGYLALRTAVLGRPFHVGVDYFAGAPWLTRALTLAKFYVTGLLWPAASGLGVRYDFSRPAIPDASAGDALAWACLLTGALALGGALWRFARGGAGAKPAFWLLSAALFFLPASNLIVPLNVIGAQRHLYFPSIGLCLLAGAALARLPRGRAWALAAACAWFGARTWLAARAWSDEGTFHAENVRVNPLSASARAGLGAWQAAAGLKAEAEASFLAAIERDPRDPQSYYNLGRLRWERGELAGAEAAFRQALERNPGDADVWIFLAELAALRKDLPGARKSLTRAIELKPWDATAHFNLAGLLLKAGDARGAARHFRKYLQIDPGAQDAPQIKALVLRLEGGR